MHLLKFNHSNVTECEVEFTLANSDSENKYTVDFTLNSSEITCNDCKEIMEQSKNK